MTVPYQKIMVTLDGSAFAAQAMPHAQSLAERYDAELILFQVLPKIDRSALETLAVDFAELHETPDQAREEIVAEAKKPLQALADDLKRQGVQARAVIEVGLPAETIIDYATDNAVDLIVMSTHGRTGLDRWVYGSVADKILRGASCPVLLVRLLMT